MKTTATCLVVFLVLAMVASNVITLTLCPILLVVTMPVSCYVGYGSADILATVWSNDDNA